MSYGSITQTNPNLDIKTVRDKEFGNYGCIVSEFDFTEAIAVVEEKTIIPGQGNIYVPKEEGLEKLQLKAMIEKAFYGEMQCQIGYCNGMNSHLNGLEFHKGSELLVAVTDLVLLLGRLQDINGGVFDSSKISAFYISKGYSVEIYSTTLHFAPCKVSETGFKSIIILPEGTNLPLTNKEAGTKLFARNKWLMVHPSNHNMVNQGAFIGISGDNTQVKCIINS